MAQENDFTYTQEPAGGAGKKGGGSGKMAAMAVKLVAGVLVLLFLALNSFYTIKEQEQAVVTTFGVAKAVTESGLHFKIPFIQQVRKVDTTIRGVAIGYDRATNESVEDESLMITRDFNFIDVDFFVEYKVSDPVKMLYASENPDEILKNVAQSSIRTVVGSYDVDSVLTTGKSEIQAAIRDMITERLEKHDIGLYLVNITIQDSEPPTAEVMEAFTAVEAAKQGKETAINNANRYKNERMPAAEARVDQIMQEAESQKQQRINEAVGQVARFNEMYAEYVKYPLITKQRMFYEAMEEILPDLKVVIDNDSGELQKFLPLDSLTGGSSSGSGNSSGSGSSSGSGNSSGSGSGSGSGNDTETETTGSGAEDGNEDDSENISG